MAQALHVPSAPAAEDAGTAEADALRRRIAVRERVRFARDLHDLLGPRLLAITLQCELALRLMDRTPESARTRLAEALSGMREIQQEARRVAHGYHCLSLDTEVDAVRGLLEAAGVRAEAEPGPAGVALPPLLQTVLATIVREASANVLRHSRARVCRIAVDAPPGEVVLTVTNDGAREPGRPDPSAREGDCGRSGEGGEREEGGGGGTGGPAVGPGLGLRSLAERIAAVGGVLAHGPYPSGHYTLTARFPFPGPAPDGPVVSLPV
ncbi:sensor histidine kinase [Streptomyces araujoniae]|uniref:sensor histidine kinase n=1 Tax=Streptomyces sp. ZEA17I TaxID=2202516 RepID=UPI00215AC5C0|nr:histidine kinase [Streptomyces sp. ZEA17I]